MIEQCNYCETEHETNAEIWNGSKFQHCPKWTDEIRGQEGNLNWFVRIDTPGYVVATDWEPSR